MSLTVELAKRVVATGYDDLPGDAIDWARVGLIDYTGVTLSGSTEPSGKIVEAVVDADEQSGPSLIFGRNARTTPLNAALINGTAAHAQDFDDCSNTIGGHPSAPILPAAIALGEKLGTGGRDLILAYILGLRGGDRNCPRRAFPSLREGLAPDGDAGRLRVDRRLRQAAGPGRSADGDRARHRRVAVVRREGEFRHHGEAAACRALLAAWPVRGAHGAEGLHGERRRLRAQAGFLRGVQRRGQLLAGEDLRDLGRSLRHRLPGHRGEAVSRAAAAPIRRWTR